MTQAALGPVRPVLVGGHESSDGADLQPLLDVLPFAAVTTAGRPLHGLVQQLLADGDATVAVLPMTWGRDPVMVADTAKTLRWLSAGRNAGRVVLCQSFGAVDHLVALLRRAATDTARRSPGAGMIIAARSANPFDDAELHRVAHLATTHGAVSEMQVACLDEHGDLGPALGRARVLGAQGIVVVPAGFAECAPGLAAVEDATFFGPLMSRAAIRQVFDQRLSSALHLLGHGHDGIAAGLLADHGHGYAHSHSVDGAGHSHEHAAGGQAHPVEGITDGPQHKHPHDQHAHDQHPHEQDRPAEARRPQLAEGPAR